MSSNKKNSHKGGKVSGPVRHFRISILDNKEIHRSEKGIGAAESTISMKANPIDAAKKLMSSICKHQGLKKMNRLKCSAIFSIKETTRGHSKMYGPYKGKFVNLMKNGKEKIVKLKTGAVIKYSVKPVVKKYKEKNNDSLKKKVNKIMKGGSGYININVVKAVVIQGITGRTHTIIEKEEIGVGDEIVVSDNLNDNKIDEYFIYDCNKGNFAKKYMNKQKIIQEFNENNKIFKLFKGKYNIKKEMYPHIFFYDKDFIECNAKNVNNLDENYEYILISKYHGFIKGIYQGSTSELFEGPRGGTVHFYYIGGNKVPENEIIEAIRNNNLFLIEEI